MFVVKTLRVLGVSIGDVASCGVLKETHRYVGCGLRSERGDLFLW